MGIDAFMEEYGSQLEKAVAEHPGEYAYPKEHIPVVIGRMREAFLKGTYSGEGRAIKQTCKALGIKPTRTAINQFIRSENVSQNSL